MLQRLRGDCATRFWHRNLSFAFSHFRISAFSHFRIFAFCKLSINQSINHSLTHKKKKVFLFLTTTTISTFRLSVSVRTVTRKIILSLLRMKNQNFKFETLKFGFRSLASFALCIFDRLYLSLYCAVGKIHCSKSLITAHALHLRTFQNIVCSAQYTKSVLKVRHCWFSGWLCVLQW